MRVAPRIVLDDSERQELEKLSRGRRVSVRLAERAKIILLAAKGLDNHGIAAALGITRQKAGRWRTRYAKFGLSGIEKDAPRPGRTPTITEELKREIVRKTIEEKPANATHWSRSLMAKEVGISDASVGRVWREYGLKPHLVETFKISNDPQFAEKLEDVVGLYLNPPENAIVLSCDEKSQIQALDRTQPSLPMKEGRGQTMTHDYKRNGTATLFAALNTLDGSIIGTTMKRHRHQEWIKFLKLIEQSVEPGKAIHIICDNYATHKHPKVRAWLDRHPRFKVHFTPTSASWLNMVERFFRDVTERRLRRGSFPSLSSLIDGLHEHIARHNENPKPFIWTATATDILAKVTRARRALR